MLLIAAWVLFAVVPQDAWGQDVFINELHYDNSGGDSGEAVEVAGPAGTDLTNWEVVLYNGNGGGEYATISLSGIIDDEGAGFGARSFTQSGIQNGAPDGLALVDDSGAVVQFLSYEGSFAATDGPANGTTSTDIGVSEPSSTPTGESLQLTGTGAVYTDFSWQTPAADNFGSLNAGQTFSGTNLTIAPDNADQSEGNSGTTPFTFTVTRSGDTSGTTDVDFAVSGTDVNGADFDGGTLPSGTVNFGAGQTTAETIPIDVAGDGTVEPDETFTVTLSNPSNGAGITTPTADGTIRDDDATGVTLIQQETFETDGEGTRYDAFDTNGSISTFSDGSGDYFTRTNGTNISSGVDVTGPEGSSFFAGQDLNGEGADLPLTLELVSANTSGFSDLTVRALFAEDDDGSNEDWDDSDSDYVRLQYSTDGGMFNDLICFAGDGSDFNSEPGIDSDCDGVRDTGGTSLTDTFAEFTGSIPGTPSSVILRVEANLDDGDEDFAIDNIRLEGTSGSTTAPDVVINEIDADTPGSDTAEFVELSGSASASLDGLVLVFFNGSGDDSYFSYDLDGATTDANGFFVLCNDPNEVSNCDVDAGFSSIQNGADAVALYQADETDFPGGTAATTTDLLSAVVYGTDDADDTNLLNALGEATQYDEDANGSSDTESLQRQADDSFAAVAPTTPATLPPVIAFKTAAQTVSEGDGSATLTVEIANPDGIEVDVDVALDSGSSADANDLGSYTTQTVTFPDGDPQTVSVTLTDDGDAEGTETATFNLANPTGGATLGTPSQFDLDITDNEVVSIVITEIMQNPSDVGDSNGEYIEVYNTTASSIDLNGWTLFDNAGSDMINQSVTVPANGYTVLCRNADSSVNGGVPCDYQWSNIQLANGDDEVILEDGSGSEIDRVVYTATWPFDTGAAMAFTGSASEDNSQEANWTQAASRQPGFDIPAGSDDGSPGVRNPQSSFPEVYAAEIDGSGAGWRMLTAPVTGADVGDLASQNAVQGVTGSFPGASPNVYVSYDGPGTADGSQYWTPATSLATTLDNGRGFIWYLYDQDDNNGSVALPFTLEYAGPAPLDDVTVSVPATDVWHLLGNPYPFAIPVNALDLTGYQTTVQVYDPAAPGYTSKSGTDLIAPQQGFFVQRNSTGSGTDDLTFESDARTTASSTLLNAESPSPAPLRRLVLQMEVRSADGSVLGRDEATVRSHAEGTLGWDRRDASKLVPLDAPYASLALEGPGIDGPDAMAIRSLPEVLDQNVEIPIQIEAAGLEDAETMTFTWPMLPDGWGAELVDREGETVRLRETSEYSVAAASVLPADALRGTSGNASTRSETMRGRMAPPRPTVGAKAQSNEAPRFVLRLTPEPLPVELTGFEATQQADGITLSWQTASETNNTGFEVQRQSAESGAWEVLTFVEGAGTTSAPQDYRFRDAQPPFADSLVYRLKQIDTDGTSAFSPKVVVRRGPGSEVQLAAPFPNPARNRAIVRYIVPDGNAQSVRLDVYNLLGQRVATLTDEMQRPGRKEHVVSTDRLASGTYFLRLQVGSTTRTERLTVVR